MRMPTNTVGISPEEIIKRFPGAESDVASVCKWLSSPRTDIEFTLTSVPIARFEKQIKEMLASYIDFPEDPERTARIRSRLIAGDPMWPIFADSSDNFILEGRHRIVAFHLERKQRVQVIFVRKK